MKTRTIACLAGGATAIATCLAVVRPWLLRWGSTDDERAMRLPGDDLVPNAKYETTHAITIDAPPEEVWKWVIQIGQDRGGFYSYDFLENLIGLDIHSADSIDPELQTLAVGDIISIAPDEAAPFTVATLDPPRAMVLRTGLPDAAQPPGNYLKGGIAGTWAFVLQPIGHGRTRLLVRWRSDWAESLAGSLANLIVLETPHCIMERKMLLGIRERAESAFDAGERYRTAGDQPASGAYDAGLG
ncbi:MAG: hypothetical protein ACOC9Y_07320 [Chloroflexota bacterium]